MISIDTAANFIKDYCLKDWTIDQIKHEIIKAITNDTLIYTVNEHGDLAGICIAAKDENKRQLHIRAIVAKGHLKDYIKYFKQKYDGYILTAYRRGKFRQIKL